MAPSTSYSSPSPDLHPSPYADLPAAQHGRAELPRRRSSSSSSEVSPSFDEFKQSGSSTWDDLLFPLPASESRADQWRAYARSAAFAVLALFLVGIIAQVCLGGSRTAVGHLPSGRFGQEGTARPPPAGLTAVSSAADEDDNDGSALSANTTVEMGSFADDHTHYHLLETLTAEQLKLDTPGHRLIVVGDLHGSFAQLNKLLDKVAYNPKDTLVHVGDLVAKGPKPLEVLKAMREHNVKGVRGNHDQPVIQWRSWFEKYLPTASLTGTPAEQDAAFTALADELTLEVARGIGFPKEWEWEGEHFLIAKRMTRDDYAYLLSLPLQIHIPSLHAIVVHAGLLPYDTRKHAKLSDISRLPPKALPWQDLSLSRLEAELVLLGQIAANTDPWVLTQMRSIRKNGQVTKDAKGGTPWSAYWNKAMAQCTRTDDRPLAQDDVGPEARKKKSEKDCYPINVLYGHAAGRGLDIKPYSFGLDSGCVYGKKLSALVLGGNGKEGKKVMFGEEEGRIVSVSC